MNEIYERVGQDKIGLRFRSYYEDACEVGKVDPAEWAKPTVSSLVVETSRDFNVPRWRSLGVWYRAVSFRRLDGMIA